MRANSLLAVALLAACQTGETVPNAMPREPINLRTAFGAAAPSGKPNLAVAVMPVVAQPGAGGVTPMQMLVADQVPRPAETAAPFSLTASDGSGLALTRIDAKAVVQGPLAYTELHLYFKNPEDRTREGTFAITLPAGAAVSRFAMEIDGKFQEAEVIEKQAARRIYDDFLHRKQDPALLEKAAGNQFTAKVFPIPARAEKHLVVSFSQELAGRGYTLPLRGLPKTDRVDAVLMLTGLDGKAQKQTLNKRDWQPDVDFLGNVGTPAAAVAAGELVVSSFAIAPRTELGSAAPRQVTLLVDTSASRALGFARYVASIRELVTAMRSKYGNIGLQVVAFDQDTQVIFDGAAAGYSVVNDNLLLARGAAGASDLSQALAALKAPKQRVVVVTDAVLTAGSDEAPVLAAIVKKLPIERVDVVLAGGIRDERAAANLVRAGLPQAGDVFDLDGGVQAVAAGLGETVLTDIAIDVPGALWVYPRTVPAARPGSPLMVYARMPRPTQQITIKVGGTERTIGVGSADPALVERAVASAEIEELENKLSASKEDATAKLLREDIAKRSVKARVISSQTSMLVLETKADYERYNIPRTALANILVIGPDGLEQQKRSDSFIARIDEQKRKTSATQQLARQQAIEEARNAGVLSTVTMPASGAFASVNGTGDVSSGFDDGNIYGGLMGSDDGESQGGFGFGRSGFGPGGGGTGSGTIGTGRYGSLGHGAGSGTGYGVSGGRGGFRHRQVSVPQVRIGVATVTGELDRAIIRRYVRRNIQKITYCYEKQLLAKPNLRGTMSTQFMITTEGKVLGARASGIDAEVSACVAHVLASIEFPKPRSGNVQVNYPMTFSPTSTDLDDSTPSDTPSGHDGNRSIPALTGKLNDVMHALRGGNTKKAFDLATKWHDEAPGDVLALIALGEVLEKQKDTARAARIYGSIIDLFPMRADMRRFAGERLERLKQSALVIDTYRRAVADRPDHATGHRLLAYAHVQNSDYASAFTAILAGVDQKYPGGRFEGAERILQEDAAMIGAAYLAHGGPNNTIMAELKRRELSPNSKPSTRFIMYWETDSNDVDFHIKDAQGGHAWYSNMSLPSGGELYADITTGYGPECFAIPGTPSAGPYKLSINYYSQGPMGYGMGLLQVQRFTGKDFRIEDRPYVVMNDGAFVELGSYQ